MKNRTLSLTILLLAVLAFTPMVANASMSPEEARLNLSSHGIDPDTYVGSDGQTHYFSLTGGQIQWIYHQAGITSSFVGDPITYADTRMYVYHIDAIQQIQNIKMADGDPILYAVLSGPLTKTTQDIAWIGNDLYILYNWHEVVSIGYPWVEFIEYATKDGKIESYRVIGGPYDATTIPQYIPKL